MSVVVAVTSVLALTLLSGYSSQGQCLSEQTFHEVKCALAMLPKTSAAGDNSTALPADSKNSSLNTTSLVPTLEVPQLTLVTSVNVTHLEVCYKPPNTSHQVTVYLVRCECELDDLSYHANGTENCIKVGPLIPYEKVLVQVSATTTNGESPRSAPILAQAGGDTEILKSLESNFTALVGATLKELQSSIGVSSSDPDILAHFQTYLTQSQLIKDEYGSWIIDISRQLSQCRSLMEVFAVLSYYWSFLDYSLLEFVVMDYGVASIQLKEDMRVYVENLRKFVETTKVSKLAHHFRCSFKHHSNFHHLRIAINQNSSQWTIAHVIELKHRLCERLVLFDCAMALACVERGSIWITWYLPDVLASQLLTTMEITRSIIILEQRVLKVEMDGIVLFDARIPQAGQWAEPQMRNFLYTLTTSIVLIISGFLCLKLVNSQNVNTMSRRLVNTNCKPLYKHEVDLDACHVWHNSVDLLSL